MRTPIRFALLSLMLVSGSAAGHHSHAMFDLTTTRTITGTVDAFDWTNPHSWLHVNVSDEAGEVVRWSLELGSPASIAREGWRPRIVSPGDEVSVVLNPVHDGSPRGSLVLIHLPDGTQLGETE
jgi:hypothetical protein